MNVEQFFNILFEEIKINIELKALYKFANDKKNFLFRKAYYCQRLDYITRNINKKNLLIWDCGCGYGTTGIFLTINGSKVHGTTVEYYFDQIPERFKYWSKYGDISSFTVNYQNIFDPPFEKEKYDCVIVQDVLHHLEPNNKALSIIYGSLKKGGKLIAIEENGNNVINNFKLFLRRGNRKIIDIYDEKQKKYIKLGNENIQSLKSWKQKLKDAGLIIDDESVEYIRLFPPFFFKKHNYDKLLQRENRIWRKYRFIKEFFYFGINFIATKK